MMELKARIERSVRGDEIRHTSLGGNQWRAVWVAVGDKRWVLISASDPASGAIGDLFQSISEDGFSVTSEEMARLVDDPGFWRLTKWVDD